MLLATSVMFPAAGLTGSYTAEPVGGSVLEEREGRDIMIVQRMRDMQHYFDWLQYKVLSIS